MLDKLNIIKQRFDEVNDLIIQPDIISDQKRYATLSKEYKDRFEVFKSWEILLRIIALFVLLLNAYFVGNLNAFILISGASLVFIIGALVFRRILIKNRRGYMLIQSIVDAACRGEIDFNDYS